VSEPRRPDPYELLARVRAEEARRARGRLKVFFGAAAGVGKTYAMLEAGQRRRKEGASVLVGVVETHGRRETEVLVEGLDVLPRRLLSYHGVELTEFDLDTALERRPDLILVDELAHTNAPGSRHAKRWQDVEELLAAGISVFTTLNVQHLESLNDVVAQVTGVVVRETVPDSVLTGADEIALVDLPPEELIQRFHEGKVYMPAQASAAIDNFFRKGNLIALRELALRRTAESVDAQMQSYRREHAISTAWPTRERLMVCVGPSPYAARLVRTTARMAASLGADWLAVAVETPSQPLRDADREQLDRNLALAERLGGESVQLAGDRAADEILAFAGSRNVTRIVVGKPPVATWRQRLSGTLLDELVSRSGGVDVFVISGEPEEVRPNLPTARPTRDPRPYLWALATVGVSSAAAALAQPFLGLANLAMLFLLGVVAVAARFGRGPSVLASLLSVVAFDFLFVPPRLSFAVADTQYLLTFAVMLVVALLISGLTARVRAQAERANLRERRTAALYSLSRELASQSGRERLAEAVARHVAETFETPALLLLPNQSGRLSAVAGDTRQLGSENERSVAQWAFDHSQPAGAGTQTLPAARALYLPLIVPTGAVGVLAVAHRETDPPLPPEQLHLLEMFANQAGLALERTGLVAKAEEARVQVEAERLRNSLLSSVSHDLRTPLAAIAGAADMLRAGSDLDDATRAEMTATISHEAERLNRMVANLLQVTRLESGAVRLERELQPIDEALGTALSLLETELADRDVRVDVPSTLPPVPVDGLLLEQVFANLLENACRYTPKGSPIEVSAWYEDPWLVVEVADRGPGVERGEEARVFDKFFRGRSGAPGTGLGLTICRGIVTAHGGTIWAENRAGGGVAFRFRLPLEAGEVPTAERS
jgi:two-component system sensor histidine kinase KdpD